MHVKSKLERARQQYWSKLFPHDNVLLRLETMNVHETKTDGLIRRYLIPGSRQFSNYWWGSIVLLGGVGFLATGVSSYFKIDVLPFLSSKTIVFFPQGLVMCFYGVLGLLFSSYLWFALLWGVGAGFNEFNKRDGLVRVFRWGFPGKNRRVDFSHPLGDIEAIRVEIREGISPRRTIYMRIKGKRDIPLTRIGQPMTLDEIETEAAELARFIQVSLELAS